MTDVDLDSIFAHREPIRKPRWRKALPWLLGAALVCAGLALLIWKVGNTGHSTSAPLSNRPADDRSQVPKTVKLQPAAAKVARDFIKTAVARKDLRRAYEISGPQIRQGQTLKEFMTGNIAVVPYPADAIDFAPYKIDFSYPREAQIELALLPKRTSKVKPQLFVLDLIKDKSGRWLVNGWTPKGAPPVPAAAP